jgi:hypothetical protein
MMENVTLDEMMQMVREMEEEPRWERSDELSYYATDVDGEEFDRIQPRGVFFVDGIMYNPFFSRSRVAVQPMIMIKGARTDEVTNGRTWNWWSEGEMTEQAQECWLRRGQTHRRECNCKVRGLM